MAPLLTILLFGLVANLCSPTNARWIGSKGKRTDQGEDCPVCSGQQPHSNHGPWEDWSMTSSAAMATPTVTIVNTATESVIASTETVTASTAIVTATGVPTQPGSEPSSSSLPMHTVTETTSEMNTFTVTETRVWPPSAESSGSTTAESASVTAETSVDTSPAVTPSSSEDSSSSATSDTSASSPSDNTSSAASTTSTSTSVEMSTSSVSGSMVSSDVSSATSDSSSISSASTDQSAATSGTSTSDVTSTSTLQSQESLTSTSSSSSTSSLSSQESVTDVPTSAVGNSSSPAGSVSSPASSSNGTSEVVALLTSTVSLDYTTFVTVVRSTIISIQVSSSSQSGSVGLPIPVSSTTNSSQASESGVIIVPLPPPLPSDLSTGTCTDDSCTGSIIIAFPSNVPGPVFEPTLTPPPTVTLPTVSLVGPKPTCSYSDLWVPELNVWTWYTLEPWCWTYPLSLSEDFSTTTNDRKAIVTVQSSAYCLCPECWLGSNDLCLENRPSGSHCGEGWWCAVTAGPSGPSHALPSGVCDDSSTTQWDLVNGCPITNKDSSTTSASYTTTLTYSTKTIAGGWIVFPSLDWKCLGPLCKDSCGNPMSVAGDAVKCILSLFTNCHIPCLGKFGFPFPPSPPHFPPIPPLISASLTLPVTHCTAAPCTTGNSQNSGPKPGGEQSGSPDPSQSFSTSGTSTTSSSSSSSSSCSAGEYITCSETVSNVTSSGTVLPDLTTITSCETATTCSGTNTATTTTSLNSTSAAPACTLSPWWNDPSLSSQIANWITQFPIITENSTEFATFNNATQTPMVNTSTSTSSSSSFSPTSTSRTSSSTPSRTPTPTTSSTPPITTASVATELLDYTVTRTSSDGKVWSELVSGGQLISATVISTVTGSVLPACGPFSFGPCTTVSTSSFSPGMLTASELLYYTTVLTDSDCNVWRDVVSGGTRVTSQFISSSTGCSTAGGPWDFSASGVPFTGTVSLPPTQTAPSGPHTLTATLAQQLGPNSLTILTCEGTAYLGSTSCDSPWAIQTVVPGVQQGTGLRISSCASWTGFVTTTPPVPPHTVQCATPTNKAVATWTPGMPFSPFVVYGPGIGEDRKDGQLWRFCEYLTDKAFNFTIREGSGNPAANVVPGVCELWDFPGHYATYLEDYPIVFGLAFDYNGCSSATDKHRNGINMPDYGTSDCFHAFEALLVENCEYLHFFSSLTIDNY
ncbi:hypothetical protein CLCR_00553 [Cladophialophora carrionii]|uniref:Uncharacterized protein n=1 Tax=Cladophialophora carrionii TaxID=86049 RepID=A0A1C1C6L3_9EURO|nr:hypothetical protein CLCR_00553 [Cladophialophora carrionii]